MQINIIYTIMGMIITFFIGWWIGYKDKIKMRKKMNKNNLLIEIRSVIFIIIGILGILIVPSIRIKLLGVVLSIWGGNIWSK